MEQNRQLAAIMFTDIAGYTAIMSENEQRAFQLLSENRQLQQKIIKQYGGRWIKQLNNGALASFSAVTDAVMSACAILKATADESSLQIRIGIHLGDVIFEEGDVFGDGVNIASRLQTIAPAGKIWITEAVHYNISNKKGVESNFVREEKLKHVKEPVRIYEVSAVEIEPPKVLVIKASSKHAKTNFGKSIAVLPFINMSNDPEQEYFSDGMAEEILNALTHLKNLKVAGRTSAFQFKGAKVDIREVGEKLGVSTVLEGSIRKQGNKLRVTAQLVNVEDGFHIWSEKYDRTLDNIFAIQDEIARAITEKLKITLFDKEKVLITKKNPTQNKEAYELYLKGRFFCNQRGPGIAKGLAFFKQAADMDPEFALAHAGLGDAYALLGFYEFMPAHQAMPKAKEAAERAFVLDPLLVEAYTTLGLVNTFYDWNWKDAKKNLQLAFQINPYYAQTHYWYSLYLSWVEGKCNEALQEARRGIELEPLVATSYNILSVSSLCAGDYEEALKASRQALELDSTSFLSLRNLGASLLALKKIPEAIEAFKNAATYSRRHPWALADMSIAYAFEENIPEAQKLYEELLERSHKEFIGGMSLFITGFSARNYDQAFEHLEKAIEQRDSVLVISKVWPFFTSFRKDPRFNAAIKKINFPEPSRAEPSGTLAAV